MALRLSSFWKGMLVGIGAFLVITGIASAVLFEATKSVPVSVTLTDVSVLSEGALEVYSSEDLTQPPLAQLEFPDVPVVTSPFIGPASVPVWILRWTPKFGQVAKRESRS